MSFFNINPLEHVRQFAPRRIRHTRAGVVCYFCLTPVDAFVVSPAPCCLAAHEWAQIDRDSAAKRLPSLFRRTTGWKP